MPRKGKNKDRPGLGHRGKKGKGSSVSPVVVISDSDSDSDACVELPVHEQVKQLHISPEKKLSSMEFQNTLMWGAGAQGVQQQAQSQPQAGSSRDGGPGHPPPSLSGFLRFSAEELKGKSLKMGQLQHPLNFTGNPGKLPILRFPQQGMSPAKAQGMLQAQAQRMPEIQTEMMPPVTNLLHQMANIAQINTLENSVKRNPHVFNKSSEQEFPPARVKSGHPPGTKIVREEVPAIRKHHGRGYLGVDEVKASVEECIEILTKAGQHISQERLEKMILEKYQVRNFSQLGLPMKSFAQFPPISEHSRLISKVNGYAQSFVRARSLCTLFELSECLKDFHSEKLEFDKLNLGPLQAMPVVYDLFKFPVDEYIPEITSLDIIEHLNEYLDKSQSWMKKIELDDFLEYLIQVYNVESPFSLGVRLRSVALAIQGLKKSKRDASHSRRKMLEGLSQSLTVDISSAMKRFRDSLMQSDKDSFPELRLHYSKLEPIDAITEIYIKFDVLATLMEEEGSAMLQHKMKKFHSSFSSFKKNLESDPLVGRLFHLAICLSTTAVEETAMEMLELQQQRKETPVAQASPGKPKKDRPSQSSVAEKMIQYINRCLQDGNLLLSHLKRIEEKIIEVFDFPSFDELGHGTFLYFLLSNSKIKEILDDCGGAMLGSTSASGDASRCFRPSYIDLKELIWQAKQAGVTQAPQVEAIICEQYAVKEAKTLGHGSVARLLSAASQPGKHQSSHFNCCFETALCGKSCPSTMSTQRVGRLGNQSREKALAVLTSCPLLEDLASWSQWSLVFQPEHGSLKEFVAHHGGRQVIPIAGGKQEAVSDFMALEVERGVLLKISSQSTATTFNEALEQGDPVLAAGHLASLIAGSKGVESSPLALLANHVKSKLVSLSAQQGQSLSFHSNDYVDPKVSFILAILMRLPLRICASVANQVLLEPLSKVVGSAKSKMAVLQACPMSWQKERLEVLGILLGIPEWTASLKEKMAFPADQLHNLVTDELFGESIDDVEEPEEDVAVESSSDSEDDDDDGMDGILSDVEEVSPSTENKETAEEVEKKAEPEEAQRDDKPAKEDTSTETQESQDTVEEGEITDDDSEDETEVDRRVITVEREEKPQLDLRVELELKRKLEQCRRENSEMAATDSTDVDKDSMVTDVVESLQSTMLDQKEKKVVEKEEKKKPLTREDLCHQVVDTIRREEFGVGIELNEEAAKLMKTQQERQGRSLVRLSRDLYSKDTHFVLELIQNADDNPYTKDILPALKFIINTSGVTIQNNEQGFEENNIRALCDVGKSTKSKHQLGYIGQKGIGFKSVFRVTNRPEVHSNGFHIYFDVNSGPMGYIMPHWNEEKCHDEQWKTQILLPWTDAIKEQIQTHAARFNDIQPSLLLFLHRLREISICNEVENSEIHMSRKDLPTGEIQITHSHGLDRWLVVKKVLDATSVSVEVKSGADVQSTEIALAFPLRDEYNTLSYGARLGQLPVFAFLPLQSYGFRFIVQGDFNVPSSRESVDKDSSWNQWLRDQIPALFIQAWDSFLSLPGLSPMQAFISYLQFVPLEGEVMGFFSPVTSLIRAQFLAKDCMPVIGPSGKTDDILWKSPSKTVMTQSSLVREIISPQILLQNLDLYFLHWDVLDVLEQGTLHALGVNTITTEHLLYIGQGVTAHWDGTQAQVVELAKWMACIYCSLDHFKENTEVFNTLRKMRLIPLSNENLVSMEDSTVFLLTESNNTEPPSRRSKKGKAPVTDPLQPLRQDVNIIHPTLTSTGDAEVNSQVMKLLNLLGIKQMTPYDLIHGHVLPTLNSDSWKEKSEPVLISYLVCAKQVLGDDPEELSRLKPVARVVTNRGVKLPESDNVHFPHPFGNDINLEGTFPMYSWCLLATSYLPPNASSAEIKSWHDFFSALGVQDFLCVNKSEVQLELASLANSAWAPNKELWSNLPDQFVIHDFFCEEFHTLATMTSVPFDTKCRLFELLDRHFEEMLRKFMVTKLVSLSGEVLKENVETSFAIHLKTLPWVPSMWQLVTPDSAMLVPKQDSRSPEELYCQNPLVEELLAHTVKYLAVKSSAKTSFTKFLQIKNSVEKEVVKNALVSWGQRAEGKPDIPAVFMTTVDHIINVYSYLQQSFPAVEIQNLFHSHPVIFMPPAGQVSGVVPGQMLKREELWWQDSCGLFSKYRDSLDKYNNSLAKFKYMLPFYRGKEGLFEIARIDNTHSILHLAELLKHITSVFALEDDGILHDVLTLFSAIGQASCKADEIEAGVRTPEAQVAHNLLPKVQALLSDCAIFPTKGSKLVSLKDQPMLADVKEWEKMFENKPSVHFLQLESPHASNRMKQTSTPRPGRSRIQAQNDVDQEMVACFLELFPDIKPLSSYVISQEITEGFKPCAKGQLYLREIIGILQLFLFYSFPAVYTEFKSSNAHHLKDLLFTEVNKLEVRYELRDRPEVFEIRTETCIVKENHFYFLKTKIDNKAEINKEVARFFSNGNEDCVREIRSFLTQAVPILEGKSKESLEDLLSRQRSEIGELPMEEEVWTIPLPTVPVVEPPPPPPMAPMMDAGYTQHPVPSRSQSNQDEPNASGEGTGLKMWPPRSSENFEHNPALAAKGSGPKKQASKFAPPEAPDYIKASKQIPSNVRFEKDPEEMQEGNATVDGEDKMRKGNTHSQPGPGIPRPQSSVDTGTVVVKKERAFGGEAASPKDGDVYTGLPVVLPGKRKLLLSESEGQSTEQDGERAAAPASKRASLESRNGEESSLNDSEKTSSRVASSDNNQQRGEPPRTSSKAAGRLAEHNDMDLDSRPAPDTNDGAPTTQPQSAQNRNSRQQQSARNSMLQFKIPMWNEQADNLAYTELTSDISSVKAPDHLEADAAAREVGRWGERLVYDYLQSTRATNLSIEDVIWANSDQEQGLPYDFEMIFKTEEQDEFYSVFIEVKTTRSDDKAVFEISSSQVEFAISQGERYQIFRVYGAGKDSLRLVRIDNVADRMKTKSVQLLMVI